jgi:hypothetical protein
VGLPAFIKKHTSGLFVWRRFNGECSCGRLGVFDHCTVLQHDLVRDFCLVSHEPPALLALQRRFTGNLLCESTKAGFESRLGKELRVYSISLMSTHVHGALGSTLINDKTVLEWMDLKDNLVLAQIFKALPFRMIREV